MLFWVALISLFLTIVFSLEVFLGVKKLTMLADVAPLTGKDFPKVSIIIPACNEESTIGPALHSILALDYPNTEIIVINDRSTDNTGNIIKTIQQKHPALKHIEISHLPENWLGKNNALQKGAEHATGEYLLFTDADVFMEKTTLSRAISHVLTNNLDHLCMIFENTAPGGLLNTVLMDLGAGLLLLLKPWKVKIPQSKYFMGVGAFNLIKSSAYSSIGGHSTFAMHPIDDIMIGKILKANHFGQDCLFGYRFIQVHWYSSVSELISGVMKNTFAAYDYSLAKAFIAFSMVFTLSIFPAWAVLFTSGKTQAIFAAIIITRIIAFGIGFRDLGQPLHNALWSIISPYCQCYIIVKAVTTTLSNKGIT